MEKEQGKIEEALLKVALGYQVAEVTEEYAEVDGKLKLTKRKRTKKDIPPDLKAMQLLLENGGGTLAELSDEQLEEEKERLLAVLGQTTGQVCDEKAKTVKRPRAKPRKRVVRKKTEAEK
ncbi:MAG: hypothetical protein IJX88_01280 [Clostridia bacterium]|nr:hypothetical protein [Clostridia bacterium]